MRSPTTRFGGITPNAQSETMSKEKSEANTATRLRSIFCFTLFFGCPLAGSHRYGGSGDNTDE